MIFISIWSGFETFQSEGLAFGIARSKKPSPIPEINAVGFLVGVSVAVECANWWFDIKGAPNLPLLAHTVLFRHQPSPPFSLSLRLFCFVSNTIMHTRGVRTVCERPFPSRCAAKIPAPGACIFPLIQISNFLLMIIKFWVLRDRTASSQLAQLRVWQICFVSPWVFATQLYSHWIC